MNRNQLSDLTGACVSRLHSSLPIKILAIEGAILVTTAGTDHQILTMPFKPFHQIGDLNHLI
jgi:hypothetical protein